MKNEKIKDFIEDLGSSSSAPGGGAAAGICLEFLFPKTRRT